VVLPAVVVDGVGGVVVPPESGKAVYQFIVLPVVAVALNGLAVSFKQ